MEPPIRNLGCIKLLKLDFSLFTKNKFMHLNFNFIAMYVRFDSTSRQLQKELVILGLALVIKFH